MSSSEIKEYLFAYGTLRNDSRHELYHVLARHADFIGDGTFLGKLYDLGEYPGAISSDRSSDMVRGEVYALRDPDRVLDILDKYEGCSPDDRDPQEFRREKATISMETGETVIAWIYLYNFPTEGLKTIVSGDYLNVSQS